MDHKLRCKCFLREEYSGSSTRIAQEAGQFLLHRPHIPLSISILGGLILQESGVFSCSFSWNSSFQFLRECQ